MSLVPYDTYPAPALDDVERGLLMLMAVCTAGAVAMAVVESAKDSVILPVTSDACMQTDASSPCTDIIVRPNPSSTIRPPPPSIPKATAAPPAPPALDAAILNLLKESDGPLTVKDLVKRLRGSEKSEVNSRLYSMLRAKKVKKIDTGKAPLWHM
jgi:hypothetical protein